MQGMMINPACKGFTVYIAGSKANTCGDPDGGQGDRGTGGLKPPGK